MDQYQRQAILSRFKSPLKDDWMMAEITLGIDTTSQAGRPQLAIEFCPVVNNVPQRDLAIRGYIAKAQPDDDANTLKRVKRRGYGFVRAVDPEFPTFPKRVSKGLYEVTFPVEALSIDGTKTMYQAGDQVAYKEYDDICRTIDAKVFQALDEIGERVEELVGLRLFIRPQKAQLGDDMSVSQFIGGYRGDMGDTPFLDDELVDAEMESELLAKLGLDEE